MKVAISIGISVACLLIGGTSSACLWIYGTTIDGFVGEHNLMNPGTPQSLQKQMALMPSHEKKLFQHHEYTPDDPAARASDAAVQTLLRGDAGKAVERLKDIDFDYPGRYFIAANLGTAYELAGDDENALKWILEGIKCNPQSHMRTEWLHARILEAKN
jgi:hypothetical protein